MAEAGAGFDIRRLLLIGGVVVVIAMSSIFFVIRGCGPAISRKPGYTVIYSDLELKDAANVIARLKELNIPYEIREDGRAVAVAKDKSDQARLGLAEKNLPLGGAVGWEIFDESRLGATDFDRRIQLIRAISGELSRTIRRIEGVEDARVQVVIPETKLFAATTAPVTAAVLLRLRPGFELSSSKINGIVHLVASSVENLQTENITVIDDSGRILTAKVETMALKTVTIPPPPPAEVVPVLVPTKEVMPSAEVILKKEEKKAKSTVTAKAVPTLEVKVTAEAKVKTKPASVEVLTTAKLPPLTPEERILIKRQAKKEIEQDLSGKAQELLNRFYPPNSIIAKVRVDIKPAKDAEIRAKDLKIKKLYSIVLIDNRIDLSAKIKQATFTTVAAAIGYDKKRGDKIIIQKVPFHLATPFGATGEAAASTSFKFDAIKEYGVWGAGLLGVVLVFWMINLIIRGRARAALEPATARTTESTPQTYAQERVSAVDQLKSMADRNPEKIAEMLKNWLSE